MTRMAIRADVTNVAVTIDGSEEHARKIRAAVSVIKLIFIFNIYLTEWKRGMLIHMM